MRLLVEVTHSQKLFQVLLLERVKTEEAISHNKYMCEYDSGAGILALGSPPTHVLYHNVRKCKHNLSVVILKLQSRGRPGGG